ncbi:hypothetical protein NDU88_005747 [Pleurodeles waltl]|uniref:Uncharacterized protein n=1 Tax=Pleurodeles waltl TaxID=8319 RepID=A0AAV7LM56_PLEWA|nr:hypothetical protein NDU88_005747 [Pleurodeles waltl]
MWNGPRHAKGRKNVAPDRLSKLALLGPTSLSTNEPELVEQTQTPTGLKTSEQAKEHRTPGQALTQNKVPLQRKQHPATPTPEAEEKEQHQPPTVTQKNPVYQSRPLEWTNRDD